MPDPASLFPPEELGYAADSDRSLHAYILVQLGLQGAVVTPLLAFEQDADGLLSVLAATSVFWVVAIWAGWFESKAWAWPGEWLRLVALAGMSVGVAMFYESLAPLLYIGPAVALGNGAWLWSIANRTRRAQAA